MVIGSLSSNLSNLSEISLEVKMEIWQTHQQWDKIWEAIRNPSH